MRSYSNSIVFEDIYDYIPNYSPLIKSLERNLFQPSVSIVELDCGTTLGKIEPVTYDLEGKIELSNNVMLSKTRIDSLLSAGVYSVATRSLDTCVSKDGVCSYCYHASNPDTPLPAVNSRKEILPNYILQIQILDGRVGDRFFNLDYDSDVYDHVNVFKEGALVDPSAYSIASKVLTLNSALTSDCNIVVKYIEITRAPFMNWLGNTYSGALLGVKSLGESNLPLRPLLHASLIRQGVLDAASDFTADMELIPENMRQYMSSIKEPLQKALFLLSLHAIFGNVST